jgi:hypothetical protein
MNERSPVAVGIGLTYAVLGVLLLLVAVDVWRPPLTVVGPVAVVACGLVLVAAGTTGDVRSVRGLRHGSERIGPPGPGRVERPCRRGCHRG